MARLLLLTLLLGSGCTSTSVDLMVDNDIFGFGRQADRNYTNGVQLRVTHDTRHVPTVVRGVADLLRFLPLEHDEWATEPKVTFGWGLKHQMYTPSDLSRQDLIVDDRPYAGILSLSFLRAEEANHAEDPQRDYMFGRKVELGIVGPASKADTLQRRVHKEIDSTYPQGWHHQLHNEPVIAVSMYSRNRGLYLSRGKVPLLWWTGWEMDTVSAFGVTAGNLRTDAWASNKLRVGWNLSRELGPYERQTGFGQLGFDGKSHDFGFHLFGGVEGRGVIHDIFLDGNAWRGSHSVTREPFVADLQAGLGFRIKLGEGYLHSTFTYNHRTPEFREREEAHIFGTVRFWYQ